MKSFIATISLTAAIAHQSNAFAAQDYFEVSNGGMMSCLGCTAAVDAARKVLQSDKVTHSVEDVVVTICSGLGIAGLHFPCEEFFNQMGFKIWEKLTDLVNKQRVCDEDLDLCSKPAIQEIDIKKAVDDILKAKPSHIQDDNFINNLYAQISANPQDRTTLKAVHLSDTHMDFEYKVGSVVDCNNSVICCREANGMAGLGQGGAREWGEYKCDTPTKTFDNLLDYIVNEVKPDVLFWTGDNSPHNTYNNTEEEVLNYTVKTTQMIKDKLAATDITVIPIQGNHDTWPVDWQDFSKPGINYQINHFKQYWADWLDSQAMEKFGEYGYYSMDFTLKNGKTLPKGSKIIAYNTTSCDQFNYNLLAERGDPGNQFAWLESELLKVEQVGGVAILLGHYDPSACMHQWGTRFRALMERFQHVVRFGMQGHEHREFFAISNSMTTPGKPVLVHSVTSGVTPLGQSRNPGFMTLDLDAETLLPVNKNTIYFDLEKANTEGKPTWVSNDYLKTWSLTDLSPNSMMDFANRIKTDKDLASQWEWNIIGRAHQQPSTSDVNQIKDFCEVATSESWERHECIKTKGSLTKYGTQLSFFSVNGISDRLISSWIHLN